MYNKINVVNMNIGSYISIPKSQLSFSIISILKEKYTYHFMVKEIEWKDGKKTFVMKPQHIMTLVEMKRNIIFPRGSQQKLSEFLTQNGYDLRVTSDLVELQLPFEISLNLQLRDYQQKALDRMLLSDEGILQAPCGSGKTVVGIAIVNKLKVTTLILTHTSVIFEQWREHFIKNLGIENVGILGGGKKEVKPITIGMVQTVHKLSTKQIQQIKPLFSCIICDEAHHVPAYTFLKIISQFNPRFLYGLTATPRRKDQKEFLLFDFLGPIQHIITDEHLIKAKRITDVEVKWIDIKAPIFRDEWHQMITALIYLQKRNELIADEIIEAAKDGHFVLVLSERIAHCELISEILNERKVRNMCICGKVKGGAQSLLNKARKDYKIIVASMAIAKEGLDIPEISCVIPITPTNNSNTLKQMIGRGRRYKEKKTLVVDFYDNFYIFSNMASNRERWYFEWGFIQNNAKNRRTIKPKNIEPVYGRGRKIS